MYGLILLVACAFMVFRNLQSRGDELSPLPRKLSDRMGKLWDIAHQGMRENRFMRAEKALLTILKIDEKNAASAIRATMMSAGFIARALSDPKGQDFLVSHEDTKT